MRRYLLVLDTELPDTAEELDRGPISYLAALHEQEPGEVVVLSLAGTPRLSSMEFLLGGATSIAIAAPVISRAPRPDHDVNAAAEHRMNRAVQHLKTIGCQASGIVSDHDMLEAVRTETRAHDYDRVILATSGQDGTRLARLLRRDPIHQLRRRWRQRLAVFPLGQAGVTRGV